MNLSPLFDRLVALLPYVLRVILIAGMGVWLSFAASRAVNAIFARRFTPQTAMLGSKGVRYGILLTALLMLLPIFGVEVTAILAAVGVLGIAIGFAAQTSLSNLISGIFLIVERPFLVGDALQVDDVMGTVHSIDLLSVSLRTFDNRYIRVPNESLVKSRFTNITRFAIRRLDLEIGVAYKEDIDHVTRVLAEVADANPNCLDEPKPIIIFKGFGKSSLDFMLGVWFEKADMLTLRNSILRDIKKRFDAENIEIPFPHISLYAGSVTDPFPVRMVEDKVAAPDALPNSCNSDSVDTA